MLCYVLCCVLCEVLCYVSCCVLCCVPCEMFCYVFRPACSDHFTDTRHTFEELLQGLNSWSIGPLTRNKLQNTEYVDNDVDVDDQSWAEALNIDCSRFYAK